MAQLILSIIDMIAPGQPWTVEQWFLLGVGIKPGWAVFLEGAVLLGIAIAIVVFYETRRQRAKMNEPGEE
jgi:hypothetical protein